MISTLYSPRVSHALEYDSACKSCFDEFNATHQVIQEKMDQIKIAYQDSTLPVFQKIVSHVGVLSLRVAKLADGIKKYIHENGVLTPRSSISPRSQSSLPNIQMLRRIKLAQNIQLQILEQLENTPAEAWKEPPKAEQKLPIKKMSIKEFLSYKNIELSFLSLIIKITDYTRKYFPSLAPTMEVMKEENQLLEKKLAAFPKKSEEPPKEKAKSRPQVPSLRLERCKQEMPTVLPTVPKMSVKERSHASFMSKTMQNLKPPPLKEQAEILRFQCRENQERLIEIIGKLTSDPYSLSTEMIFKFLRCFEKTNGRIESFWSTLKGVKSHHDQLFAIVIQGIKCCQDLQLRYLASLEALLLQLEKKGPIERDSELQALPEEFEEEFKKLDLQTAPLVVNLSALIKDILCEKIARKTKSLLKQVERSPEIKNLLTACDVKLFKAETDLEEKLECLRDAGGVARDDILRHCRLIIGAYQLHEIVQKDVLKQLERGASLV